MVRGFWWVVWGFWWVVRGFWWVVWGFWWVVRAKNGLRTAGATYTPAPGLWSPFSPHGLDGSGGFGGPDGLDTRDGRARRARCATGGEGDEDRTTPARRTAGRHGPEGRRQVYDTHAPAESYR